MIHYNTENVDPYEFKKLVDLTVTAFENADKMSDCLKQESSRKTSISVLLTMPKPLTVWITINCGKF